MDEVTQQNAALVEEAAAAAESMSEQAQELIRAVGAFTLAGGNHSTMPVTRRNRSTVAKLPDRGPATKQAGAKSKNNVVPVQPRKVAAGGSSEDWDEF